jgi:hypothetical protein
MKSSVQQPSSQSGHFRTRAMRLKTAMAVPAKIAAWQA